MKHVLIAEDSKAIRSLIRIALEEAGDYFATEAANGFEALRLLPTKTFDLIITDINMPDINGLELIGFVRSNPSYKDIPLIIVSTEKTEEDKRRGLALGAFGYLVKPFKKEDLIALVSRAVKRT
ncbi:MAG: response regulator [Nitrospiraceae bacterium]|nr:response regulator [Nitrospiraceae bacterium]